MSIQRVEVIDILMRKFLKGSMLVIPLDKNQVSIFIEKKKFTYNCERLAKLILAKNMKTIIRKRLRN